MSHRLKRLIGSMRRPARISPPTGAPKDAAENRPSVCHHQTTGGDKKRRLETEVRVQQSTAWPLPNPSHFLIRNRCDRRNGRPLLQPRVLDCTERTALRRWDGRSVREGDRSQLSRLTDSRECACPPGCRAGKAYPFRLVEWRLTGVLQVFITKI
jgi:hypothetical protein